MTSKRAIRAAIYTRKSSDEGLEQDFNSLDAQFEACAAYVASQRHEGWKLSKGRYDDGGVSGGTLERPGLQRLLADIEGGRIEMVVVYKIDRLTRSLADFAKLVERFEAAGCSFVSVTQAFNTSSSMGRLTLNVLLSFAQFEREVTAERIRDKIAASKKKGLWMGGNVPLGYDRHPDPTRRELVVNTDEARTVETLFRLYAQHGCLKRVETEAAKLELRSKRRVFASGRVQGGNAFSRGQIYHLLRNPTYLGKIRHKDKVWPGLHKAIVDEDLFEKVQAKLQVASVRPRGRMSKAGPNGAQFPSAPLAGKIRDETGDLLTPTHTQRHGRRLRYYVSNRLISGGPDPSGWRLPAPAFEAEVARIIAKHLEQLAEAHTLLAQPDLRGADLLDEKIAEVAGQLHSGAASLLVELVESGSLEAGKIVLNLSVTGLANSLDLAGGALSQSALMVTVPFSLRRRGVEMKIVAGGFAPAPDPTLIQTLAKAHRWAGALKNGTPISELARRERVSPSYLRQRTKLAFLSPAIQNAILEGRQPIGMTTRALVETRIPLAWEGQAATLANEASKGFPDPV
ncbi:MAG: recombinase family protein [Paracoccaceae bacterium]|nr:recombinase family protein [Paracoccaceae bacterium]